MRVPLSWLQDYVDIRDVSPLALAETLTLAGLEVAEIEYVGLAPAQTSGETVAVAAITTGNSFTWDREKIRVGHVVSVDRHPNADRLVLATVDYGGPATQQVVTGAPNVRAGQKVAFATIGATVRNGHSETHELVTLKPAKLRGVPSEGMVLSELELGLSDEHEGIIELPEDAPVGTPLADYLGDVVLTIELTPNLGRAYSIVGTAREVAALLGRPPKSIPQEVLQEGPPLDGQIALEISDPQACPRFTAMLIRDVQIGPSPFWIQRRLALAGMRPINNIVDITNYVMLETGQPLHAFDYDVLVERAQRAQGANACPTLRMRYARPGETLTTLDGNQRQLAPTDYLVSDTAGALSLAGVMGGAEGEVTATTRNVLLEAANWNFIMIRRTQQRHLLFSEAGLRFSRGIHPAQSSVGNRRAAELMRQLAHGTVAQGMIDTYLAPPPQVQVEITSAEVQRLLGMNLSIERIAGHLHALLFSIEMVGPDKLLVTAPDHRLDITGAHDLIEEIARIEGYRDLPATLMSDPLPPMRTDPTLTQEERIRDLLVAAGLQETISYALTSPEREAALIPGAEPADISEAGYIRLANPSSQDRRVLRRTMLVSALENLQRNLRFRDRVALFEVGLIYLQLDPSPTPNTLLPNESRRLVIAMTGPVRAPTWHEPTPPQIDFFDLKGIVEMLLQHLHLGAQVRYTPTDHPSFQAGRVADLWLGDTKLGTLGELHPLVRAAHDLPTGQRVAIAELALDMLIHAAPSTWATAPVPRFPAIVQDLAVLVPTTMPAALVEEAIQSAGGDMLESVRLFDVYEGPAVPNGMRSLAYSLSYLASDRTLRDAEVATIHARITRTLRDKLGLEVRGQETPA